MSEITYISRHELDIARYDACISNAINSRIYAYSWYLDIVAEHWDVLVYGNYDAVMPLTWKRKFGIKYITIPPWVQQMGVISSQEKLVQNVDNFIKEIPKKFKKIDYQFNDFNEIEIPDTVWRNNYILTLNNSYVSIYNGFSKMRQRILTSLNIEQYTLKENQPINVILNEYKRYIQPKSGHSEHDINLFRRLYNEANRREKAFNVQVWQNEMFLSGVIFFKSNHRLYSIFLAQTQTGKEANTTSMIYQYVIEKYQNTAYILDFEGSNIHGVKTFIESFGAVNKPYVLWHKATRLMSVFYNKN